MRNLKELLSNRMVIFGILFVVIIGAAVSFGYRRSKDAVKSPAVTEVADGPNPVRGPVAEATVKVDEDLSKLVLNVSNMSCSGCISTIKSSVAGSPEIKDTLVDLVAAGRVDISSKS